MTEYLKQLRDLDLFAIARNPSAGSRLEALGLLKSRGSVLAKHPDVCPPEPDRRPKRPKDIPATFDRTVPRHHIEEVFEVLKKVPSTHLIDMAAADTIYSKEIRLFAAELIHAKIPTNREFARKVMVKRANDGQFNQLMLETTPELVPR